MYCKICAQPSRLLYKDLYDDRHGYPGSFDLYRCDSCGFGQLQVPDGELDVESLYTRYYPRRSWTVEQVSAQAAQGQRLSRRIFNNVECHRYVVAGRTLDIGCGTGQSLLELRAQGIEACGTEFDENVRRLATALGLAVHFGPLHTADFPKGSFANVTATQVIEHVPDPLVFIEEAAACLAANGRLYISFPNFDALTHRLFAERWLHHHVPYHLNFFSRRSIELLMARAGLVVERVATATPPNWLAKQLLNAWLPIPPGQPDRFWEGEAPPRVFALLKWLCAPAALVLDSLNLGDSFIVVARTKG